MTDKSPLKLRCRFCSRTVEQVFKKRYTMEAVVTPEGGEFLACGFCRRRNNESVRRNLRPYTDRIGG